MDNEDIVILFSENARQSALNRLTSAADFFLESDFAEDCDQLDFREQIAAGSYGRVYTASVGSNTYAVKVEDFHDGDEEQANLLVELTILQSLPHERLVKFIIAGCDQISTSPKEYKIMIVMELCKNGALRELLKRKLSWPLKIRLALDIAQGIAFLHENGIIHRDIKPQNVLVDHHWRGKLCDFSFAIHKDSETKREYTYGTEEFMPPEIAFALDFDLSADIFSFGILLCEMMTDTEPSIDFMHRKPQDSFSLNEAEVRTRILPNCPEALEALAFQCCESDPLKRPTADTCVEELETIFSVLGGKVSANDLPSDDSLVIAPEIIQQQKQYMNSPEREGRVQSTKNITIDYEGNLPVDLDSNLDSNKRIKELEAEIVELRHESKKMSKELHSLTIISAERDLLLQKLLSKMNGNEFVVGIGRTELKDLGTDMIINKLENNVDKMENEINDIESIGKQNILDRLSLLEIAINDMKIKLKKENPSTTQSSRIPSIISLKPIEGKKEKDKESENSIDVDLDLMDFPAKKVVSDKQSSQNINRVNNDIVPNNFDKENPNGNGSVIQVKDFPVPLRDKQPTAELSNALGSFLNLIDKCSENNNRTRELMSNLDRIADAKLSYNTPNKLKVIDANRGISYTPNQSSTLKDFTWREVQTPLVSNTSNDVYYNGLRSPRAESSFLQDTISKKIKSVSPSHVYNGKFSPRISSSSSIGKSISNSILNSSETEIEKKMTVSKFFEPPPSLTNPKSSKSYRIDSVSTLDRSLHEKADYNRRLVHPPSNSNPVLERFTPEKTNAEKYQELLEKKYNDSP